MNDDCPSVQYVVWDLQSRRRITIPAEEFQKARAGKNALLPILAIEEKYDLLLQSYIELERELLDIALSDLVYVKGSPMAAASADIQRLNRRVINLLSACRSYTDQTKREIASATNSIGWSELRFSEQYDLRLGFRAMEALRNYAQHHTFPVHILSRRFRWVNDMSHMEFRVAPRLELEELSFDQKFKASVFEELKAIGESVPLMPLIRDYIEGLSTVHQALRDELASRIQDWESGIIALWSRVEAGIGSKLNISLSSTSPTVKYINVRTLNDSASYIDEEQFYWDSFARRQSLSATNPVLVNLPKRFVSSMADLDEK